MEKTTKSPTLNKAKTMKWVLFLGLLSMLSASFGSRRLCVELGR